MWKVRDNGFLPAYDPILSIGSNSIEELAYNLPKYVANHSIRKELVNGLSQNDINSFLNNISDVEVAERTMMLFSYFASSYIHAPDEPIVKILPKEIAVPLVKLAEMVSRPPILSYASYCLYNWKKIDKSKSIELGNIELLQNFTLSDGRRDENWFILVHVDIEAKASKSISAIKKLIENPSEESIPQLLEDLYQSSTSMYETLCRMEEECSTDIYFDKVRPYIFSYENIIFEGWRDEPLTYRGETGAQSSCIPAIQTALGVKHKDNLLTVHLTDMRNYMPAPHREWLSSINNNFRDYAIKLNLKNEYNKCVGRLVDFRKKHLEYAVNYIQKKVSNPKGTGGTPYVKWLSELITETETFYL